MNKKRMIRIKRVWVSFMLAALFILPCLGCEISPFENVTEKASQTDPIEPKMSEEKEQWREVYARFLEENENFGFYVGDVNGSGFPALVLRSNDFTYWLTTKCGGIYHGATDIDDCNYCHKAHNYTENMNWRGTNCCDECINWLETNCGSIYYFTDRGFKTLALFGTSYRGRVGYLEETNQIFYLRDFGDTTGTFGFVELFLYDWTSDGYVETRSLIRESGYCDEYDASTKQYLVKEYGQGYINGKEVDFDEFEIALTEMKALWEKSTWFPMTTADEAGDYFDYLSKWKP